MTLADLGLIGNCQLSALVRRDGAIVWCCMPRFDSPAHFLLLCLMIATGANSPSALRPTSTGVQRYLPNTNVLETRFEDEDGAFRVLDFAPRFMQYERSFRPTKLVRIVEPLSGTPRIRVHCDPVLGWSRARPRAGSALITSRYHGYRDRASSHHRRAALVPQRRAVRSHRAQALRAGLGRAGRRAARAALRSFLCARPCATGSSWVKHCDIPPHLPGARSSAPRSRSSCTASRTPAPSWRR